MDVRVKQFAVDMEVKTNGMELEVRKPDDSAQIGDCFVTKAGPGMVQGQDDEGERHQGDLERTG